MATKIRGDQLDSGTGPNQVVTLDGSSQLPAVDGSQLTKLPGIANIIEDTSPQLGGNLDVNNFDIVGAAGVGSPSTGGLMKNNRILLACTF